MPPIETGPRGGSDEPLHLAKPPDHKIILEHIDGLTASLRDIFKKAVKDAEPEIAQQKAVSEARLEVAFAGVDQIASQLAAADALYRNEDAHGRRKSWNVEIKRHEAEQSGQSTTGFSREITQIRRAYNETLRKVDESIHFKKFNLKSSLDTLARAITEAFEGLPKALAATEPGARKAELLDAKLLVARMDIERLREQLSPTASSTASRTAERAQTDSSATDLPLGHIDLDTFLKESPERQHLLGNVIRIYHAAEHEPDDFLIQEQFSMLSRAFDGISGDSALEKTDNLCRQFADYEDRGAYSSLWIQEQNGYLPETEVWVRYEMLQFSIPLSRLWQRD